MEERPPRLVYRLGLRNRRMRTAMADIDMTEPKSMNRMDQVEALSGSARKTTAAA